MGTIYAYCKCENCGNNLAKVNMAEALTSIPPQYKYSCADCGYNGIVHNEDIFLTSTIATEPDYCLRYYGCPICGEEVSFAGEICAKCKEAVKYMRKQMEKEKKNHDK